jgi:hypothetical protein
MHILARLINFDSFWIYPNLESSILDAVERSRLLAYLDSDSKWYLFDGWYISSACLCQCIWTLGRLFNPTQMAFNQEACIFEPSSKIWYTSGCTFQHNRMNWSAFTFTYISHYLSYSESKRVDHAWGRPPRYRDSCQIMNPKILRHEYWSCLYAL